MSGEQAGQPATYITINIESKTKRPRIEKNETDLTVQKKKKKKKAMQTNSNHV